MKKSKNVRWSESLHRKATRLLASSRLLETLEKQGHVLLLGSYPAKLMVHGDIDIHVVCDGGDNLMQRVLEAHKEIALTGQFQHLAIWDWSKRFKRTARTRGFPRGCYLGLKTRRRGVKWKIDIWFLDAREGARREQKELNVQTLHVSPTQRETILAFKKLRNEADLFFSSQRIYDLVILKGMTSRTAFKAILVKEGLKE